jgi:hypothetical protein
MSSELTLKLPKALADELVSEGLAEPQETDRSSGWELVYQMASSAAVVVTLFQTPATLKGVAAGCKRLLKQAGPGNDDRLEAIGPGGQLRLRITPETDLTDFEDFLKRTIFTDLRQSDEPA